MKRLKYSELVKFLGKKVNIHLKDGSVIPNVKLDDVFLRYKVNDETGYVKVEDIEDIEIIPVVELGG